MSRYSKQSRISAAYPKSEVSKLSSKTYIEHLQSELEEEKLARQRLESELQELRKMSMEISSHLASGKLRK
jgi:predicted RNase H-like nuclease (RuvC/YqgF family)